MTNGNFNFFDPNDPKDKKIIDGITKIIKQSIRKTNLNLSNLTILTEAATGYWTFTPIIAAFAKANLVICITKDSKYGIANQIISNFDNLIKYLNFKNIKIYKKISPKILQNVDIVTNSGFVRPINHGFIKSLKPTCVISLMWEPWEYRKSDIDLFLCRKKQIGVLGVNEDNEIMNIMKYNGELIYNLIKRNNIKLKNKKVILVAENKSAFYMIKPIKSLGASFFCVSKTMSKELSQKGATVIGNDLNDSQIEPYLKNCDLIIINSAPLKKKIIGGKDGLKPLKLKKLSSKVTILLYFGKIDFPEIKKAGIHCIPSAPPVNEHMSWTLDVLGPTPVIELSTLGLKAVEKLAKCRKSGLNYEISLKKGLDNPFAADFSDYQKKQFKK